MAIDWADILKLAVSSSVLTTLATWGLNHLEHRATLNRDSRYLAQQLAIILERFSDDCASIIYENKNYETFGRQHECLPALGPYPTDADWKLINDPALREHVMSMLPNDLKQADEAIRFRVNQEGLPDDYSEIAQSETNIQAELQGLKAWALACKLRKDYRLPASKSLAGESLRQDRAIRQKQEAERAYQPVPGLAPPA